MLSKSARDVIREMRDCPGQHRLSWQGKKLLQELLSTGRDTSEGLTFRCSEKVAWAAGLKPRSYAKAVSELVGAGFIKLNGVSNGIDYFIAAYGWREKKENTEENGNERQ